MSVDLDELIRGPVFGVPESEKSERLAAALGALTEHHRARCTSYRRILDALWPAGSAIRRIEDVPPLPVGLFKTHELKSVPDDEIVAVVRSSGTTGQAPSQAFLDRRTAERQRLALSRIMTHVLGPRRLPFLVIDRRDLLRSPAALTARAAGVIGMMSFGTRPTFVLDENEATDVEALERFLGAHGREPFLVFGFTFMVWEYLFRRLADRGLDLSHAILVHSGGWKKLKDEAVDNATFRARLRSAFGLERIYNFYGMAEQTGSVFLEGDDGLLHPPAFADVVVRDPATLEPLPDEMPGLIETVSAIPESYPGHALLTEDLGVIRHRDRDTGGRLGKAFEVLGRVPRAELRGCSDTHAAEQTARR